MSEVEELRRRLEAAERVCVLYSWTGHVHDSDRGKALHELWAEWAGLPGTSWQPEDHPDLSDERISELARRRDDKRARTLDRIYGEGR
jgi:hypothetical protein